MTDESHADQCIQDEHPKFFIMLPHSIMRWPGMTHTALHLYLWYRMVCGEHPDGRCWQSLKTLAEGCGMREHTVIAARNKLEELGLIIVEKVGQNGTSRIYICLLNTWPTSPQHATAKPPESRLQNSHRDPCKTAIGTPAKQPQVPLQNSHTNKNPLNKIKGKKKGLLPQGGTTASPSFQNSNSGNKGFTQPDEKPKEQSPAQKWAERAAKELFEALSKKRKLCGKYRKPKLGDWRRQFSEFIDDEWERRKHIKVVFLWYCENIGVPYVPAAYAAKTFIDRFVDIEDARERFLHDERKDNGEDEPVILDKYHGDGELVRAWFRHHTYYDGCRMNWFESCTPAIEILKEWETRWEAADCPMDQSYGVVPGDELVDAFEPADPELVF